MHALLYLFMFAYVIVSSLAGAGCAAEEPVNHDGDPVDGPYTLALTGMRSVCHDVSNAEGESAEPFVDERYEDTTAEIDAFLRPDGRLDLRHSSNRLPGFLDGMVPGIDRWHGEVNQFRHVASQHSTTAIRSLGKITPETMSLDFVEYYDDGSTSCTFVVHAEGTRRPLADAKQLDGYYAVTLRVWEGCPADRAAAPLVEAPTRLDAAATAAGKLDVVVQGTPFRFTMAMPGTDGTVDYRGQMKRLDRDPQAPSEWEIPGEGTAQGTLSPDVLGLIITYADEVSAAEGCESVLEVIGSKFIPSREAIENDYRMQFDITSDCESERPDTKFGTATVVESSEGRYVIADIGARFPVELENGRFDVRSGDLEADWFENSITGLIAPPLLDYVVTQTDRLGDGSTCTFSVHAHGETRYVF